MMRRLLTIAASAGYLLCSTTAATADTCLGEPCPYSGAGQIGQSGNGVLRFPQAVAVGPDGNVYVSDQSSHIVQVFSPDGRFVRQFGTPGTKPGQLTAVSSITVTPGNLLALTDGGTNRVVLFKAATGEMIGSLGGSGSAAGQFRFGAGGGNDQPAGGAITNYKGHLYVSDSGNDRIQRIDTTGQNPAVLIDSGVLAHPRGLAVRQGRLIVADDQNHRLAVFGLDGKLIRSVGAGKGAGPGQLSFPFGVATDSAGATFVADDMNQRIVRFGAAPDFTYRARWGSYGTAPGQLAYPRALATNARRELLVTNTGNDRIDVFSGRGTLLRSFGSSGRAPGQFNAPAGVAVDASGIRAVADTINGRVQLLNPDGSVASIWGSPNPGPTILRRPVDVAFDEAGNGYVLDQRRGRIFVFNRATALNSASFGTVGTGPGQLLDPSAIARTPDGTLWIADTGNSRVARFSSTGSYGGSFPTGDPPRGIAVSPDGASVYVTTTKNRVEYYDTAGKLLGRFGFGPGSRLGQLNAPAGLTVDAAGTVWIADRGNNRIAHFGPTGKRLGTFGARGSTPGAVFSGPTGVAVDCRGTLTVTDTRNNVVRFFPLTTPPAGASCATLPVPGQPPALQYPTLPAPDGPLITLKSLRRTRLLTSGVAVRAGCDTTCTLTVTATLTQTGLPPKRKGGKPRRRVTIALSSASYRIDSGATKVIRLVASQSARNRLRAALAGRKGVVASITATATASVGEPSVEDLRVAGSR